MTMHLAGWNFTIHEDEGSMHVIDVMIPDFSQAKASALQQYKPGSAVADFRPLSEEELKGALPVGSFRKWISLNEPREEANEPGFSDLWPHVEMVNFVPK
ncbi:MAG TPA: hypothetical protein VM144_01455 [Aestuariivirga sp.]|nr:hypothetical protein [Aestuariivirga sp.]